MRIAVRFLQQVRADALEPCRLDVRDRAREQPRGLDQFGRHDPAPGLLQQRGARPDVKPDAARSNVRRLAALGIEQRQPTLPNRPASSARCTCSNVAGVGFRRQPCSAARADSCPCTSTPLAHAARAQKLAPELFGQFAVRFLVADRLMTKFHNFTSSQEVDFSRRRGAGAPRRPHPAPPAAARAGPAPTARQR